MFDPSEERLQRAASGEAEFELIGSLLLSGETLDDVAGILRPEHFASERLRDVCDVLLRLRHEDRPTTAEAVAGELGADDALVCDLLRAMELVPHGLNAEHYARLVKEGWQRRSFELLTNDSLRELKRPGRSSDEVLNQHVRQVERLLDDEVSDDDGHISDHLLTLDTGQAVERFTTGLDDLDTLLDGGIGAGQLVCIGARPSVGKTAFCSGMALAAARTGVPVLLLSLEMTGREMTDRCRKQAGIRNHDDHSQLNELAGKPLYIRDAAGWSIDRLEAEGRRYSRRHGVKLLIVDYLSLVRPRDSRPPRYEQVADISRSLKLLALRTGLAVIAAQQLSRDIERRPNRRPMMSDFRESGSIEQDADVLIGLDRPVRPDEGDRTEATLYLMKNRHGETGNLNLTFDPQQTLFAESSAWPIDDRAAG